MKFNHSIAVLLAAPAVFSTFVAVAGHDTDSSCTHGKLYVSDTNSNKIHAFDVSTGKANNLTPETNIVVAGGPGIDLEVDASGKHVAALFRGTMNVGYTIWVINFIGTGFRVEDQKINYVNPSLVANAAFECSRPIHFVRHDGKIAIFCDGSYVEDVRNNSTVWVLEEMKFGSTPESAIVFDTTLQGSHHGVVVPVDDNHVLYSLASSDRINRTPEGDSQSLPATFQVTDYQGNVLHSLTNETDPSLSCLGFHGSWALDNTFALACNAEHGGILIVDYMEAQEAYTSRALLYPEAYVTHRTGSFAEHPRVDFVLANFADAVSGEYHLMAFHPSEVALTDDHILPLDGRQCAFAFEQGEADIVLVLMPNGVLHAFEFDATVNRWEEVAQSSVVPDLQTCSQALFVPGIGQAFVIDKDNQIIFGVDLSHVHEGKRTGASSTLDFVPFSAVVSGASLDAACHIAHDDHRSPSAAGQNDTFMFTRGMAAATCLLTVVWNLW